MYVQDIRSHLWYGVRRRRGTEPEREGRMGAQPTLDEQTAEDAADQAAIERFEDIAAALSGHPGVGRGAMFGAPVLKVDGKVLAALRDGKRVLKLPPDRIGALVAGGHGEPFTAYGKTMRGWVAVPVAAAER